MKYIIVTDTHLGFKNGSDEYHNITKRMFIQLCNTAKERGITKFIHGGDFFDSRRAISVKTIPAAYEILNIIKETFDESYFIVGNHDTYYKSQIEPTSLEMFENIEGISVVKYPIVLNNKIHLQPWLVDEFIPLNADYLIGHFEMTGIIINRIGTEYKAGLPISTFKDYKKVMSGHFHTKSETKNITYLGSPYHMTFNDDGSRGYHIFDDEDGSLEFIEFKDYPKFIVFTHENIDYDKVEGNNIRITFTKDIGTTKVNTINNKVYKYNPNQLFIEFSFDDSFSEENNDQDIEDFIDIRTIEKKYLDKAEIPEYINRNKIDNYMDKLWEKIKQK